MKVSFILGTPTKLEVIFMMKPHQGLLNNIEILITTFFIKKIYLKLFYIFACLVHKSWTHYYCADHSRPYQVSGLDRDCNDFAIKRFQCIRTVVLRSLVNCCYPLWFYDISGLIYYSSTALVSVLRKS